MSTPMPAIDARQLLADSIAGRFPDARGRFGPFGGRYVPETLIPALERLESGMRTHLHSRKFQERFTRELASWVGRPTALTHAARLSKAWGAQVWLKREDLAHTGAHKINNALGQALLAQELGAQTHHRRDRSGPAWCGECRRMRAARHALHGIHGRDRYGTPGAERRAHATHGRDRRAGDERRSDLACGHR